MSRTTKNDYEHALNWFLKQAIINTKDGEINVMKLCHGDPFEHVRLRPQHIAEWIAEYHKEFTPQREPPTDGRKFRTTDDKTT